MAIMKTRRQAQDEPAKKQKQDKKEAKKPAQKDPDPDPPKSKAKRKAADAPAKVPDPPLKDLKRKKRNRSPSPDDQPAPDTGKPAPDTGKAAPPDPVTPAPDQPEEKIVKQLKKGSAAVDSECPRAKDCHVFENSAKVWTATLNQTDVKNNANKYYIIQLLQADATPDQYYVWNRWGRVGYPGQNALKGPFGNFESAKTEFTKKLADKTRGGYVELEIVYEEEETKQPAPAPTGTQPASSTLDRRVQDLVRLIFDLNMIKKALEEIGYDAKKMPLGKLSSSTLKKGFEVLKKIEAVLNQTEVGNLDDLSGQFYSLIPHDFGFQHMSNFTIKTKQRLKEKIEMLESLSEMKIATTMLSESVAGVDPVDEHYAKLHCQMRPIEKDTALFKLLETYVENTHAKTHSNYSLTILEAFEVGREGEDARFRAEIPNHMLLWHGSRLTNWVGILSQGLRIAPPEAPVTGYMFGKGVYFADMVSKSANYCFTSRENNVGCMMLCEVACGEFNELLHADYNANNLPPGKLCTKGCGKTAPTSSQDLDGMKVPCGPAGPSQYNGSLLYNEFIVYDVAQIKMKYLFKMRFNYR